MKKDFLFERGILCSCKAMILHSPKITNDCCLCGVGDAPFFCDARLHIYPPLCDILPPSVAEKKDVYVCLRCYGLEDSYSTKLPPCQRCGEKKINVFERYIFSLDSERDYRFLCDECADVWFSRDGPVFLERECRVFCCQKENSEPRPVAARVSPKGMRETYVTFLWVPLCDRCWAISQEINPYTCGRDEWDCVDFTESINTEVKRLELLNP